MDEQDSYLRSSIGMETSSAVEGDEAQESLAGDLPSPLSKCLLCVHQIPLPLSCQLLISVSDPWLWTWLLFLSISFVYLLGSYSLPAQFWDRALNYLCLQPVWKSNFRHSGNPLALLIIRTVLEILTVFLLKCLWCAILILNYRKCPVLKMNCQTDSAVMKCPRYVICLQRLFFFF